MSLPIPPLFHYSTIFYQLLSSVILHFSSKMARLLLQNRASQQGFTPGYGLLPVETYYDYPDGMTKENAHAKVKDHLSSNMRHLLFHERQKAYKRVAVSRRRRTTRRDVKPPPPSPYVDSPIWNSLCDWWDSSKFKAMLEQNKINRAKHGILHTTGAKPYIIFRQELEKKNERPVTHVEFFEATHKSAFWIPAANRMKNVLVKLWDEYRASHTQGSGDESEEGASSSITPPLSPSKWRRLEADIASQATQELGTKTHLKNTIFMEGRAKMSNIYGINVPSTGRIMAPCTKSAHLTDDFFQQAIGHAAVIAHAKDGVIYVRCSELDAEI